MDEQRDEAVERVERDAHEEGPGMAADGEEAEQHEAADQEGVDVALRRWWDAATGRRDSDGSFCARAYGCFKSLHVRPSATARDNTVQSGVLRDPVLGFSRVGGKPCATASA